MKSKSLRKIHISGSVNNSVIVLGDNNLLSLGVNIRIPRQISPPPLDFVGRKLEIKKILDSIKKKTKLLGFSGMGGIGKTALGLMIVSLIEKKYPDGQVFVNLGGFSQTKIILSSIDAMKYVIKSFIPEINFRIYNDLDIEGLYRSVLADRKVILFFDNAHSTAQIRPLVPPDSCLVIFTSRKNLPLPGLRSFYSIDQLSKSDAEKFISELCPQVGSEAKKISELSGYIPLALRISGNFLNINKSWSVKKYINLIKVKTKRLKILSLEKDLDLNLRAVLSTSYQELERRDMERWRILSIFPNHFDVESFSYILDLDIEEAKFSLNRFLSESLLQYDEGLERFYLHDILKYYAKSMPLVKGNLINRRYAEYYLKILENAQKLYKSGGGNIIKGLDLFDLELDNIFSAQRWAKANMKKSRRAAELCAAYPGVGSFILNVRQKPRDRIKWLEQAVEASKISKNKKAEYTNLNNLGLTLNELGEYQEALKRYKRALKLAQLLKNTSAEGSIIGNIGSTYLDLEDYKNAESSYLMRYEIAKKINDKVGEGNALNNLGLTYTYLGRISDALETYNQRLSIAVDLGDKKSEANVLSNIGLAYTRLNQPNDSLKFCKKSILIARKIGANLIEANANANLGVAYNQLGNNVKAKKHLEIALQIYEFLESPKAVEARTRLKMLDDVIA